MPLLNVHVVLFCLSGNLCLYCLSTQMRWNLNTHILLVPNINPFKHRHLDGFGQRVLILSNFNSINSPFHRVLWWQDWSILLYHGRLANIWTATVASVALNDVTLAVIIVYFALLLLMLWFLLWLCKRRDVLPVTLRRKPEMLDDNCLALNLTELIMFGRCSPKDSSDYFRCTYILGTQSTAKSSSTMKI